MEFFALIGMIASILGVIFVCANIIKYFYDLHEDIREIKRRLDK